MKFTYYIRHHKAYGLALLALIVIPLVYFWGPATRPNSSLLAIIVGTGSSSSALEALVKEKLNIKKVVVLNVDLNTSYLNMKKKYCSALLGRDCGILPLTIVVRSEDVAFAIVGVPSDELLEKIEERVMRGAYRFIAFSGPDIFVETGCPECTSSYEIEVIFSMPRDFPSKAEKLGGN